MRRAGGVEVWEIVAGGLWRLPVPGGWLYATEAPGVQGRALAFVPSPAQPGQPQAAAGGVLGAIQARIAKAGGQSA